MTTISKEKLTEIREKYGLHASWAIWAVEKDRPKSNMGDLSIFEDNSVLKQLNPNNILVAYNFSVDGKVLHPWEKPQVLIQNVERFEKEVTDLGVNSPRLYALGNDVFEILKTHLSSRFRIDKITHYAWQRSKEQYREKILEQLGLTKDI